MAAALKEAPPPPSVLPPVEPEATITAHSFDQLFDLYERERSVHKKGTGPTEDQRRKKIWMHFLQSERVVYPAQLDEFHLDKFIRLRRHGDLQVPEVQLRDPAPAAVGRESREVVVQEGTIDADLVYLNTVLNWATRKKENGRPLLDRKPVHVPRLKTRNPRRPVASHDDYRPLLRYADPVDPQRLFGCFLRLLNNLGWRVSAICYIRADDLDLTPTRYAPFGRIRKNHLVDKKTIGDWVPMSRHTRATVLRILERTGRKVGERRFLFSGPRRAGEWTRQHVRDMMERAEAEARIAHIGGEHAWRRKWFSERKDYPLADLMRAGGHADPKTVAIYQQADPETTYKVVARPTHRIRRDKPV